MREDGITVRQRPINLEEMRISVLEKSSEAHTEAGLVIKVARTSTLTDGTDVQVVRNGVGEIVETRAAPPPVQKIEDPSLPRGKEVVVNPGKPGVASAIMKVYVQNGEAGIFDPSTNKNYPQVTASSTYTLSHPNPPVALLQGPLTASASTSR